MASLGKHNFTHTNLAGETMQFDTAVSVTDNGVFSIVIPPELEDTCLGLGYPLEQPQKNLFLRGRDLELLKGQVRKAMEVHLQTERICERVIVYSTDIKVAFWQNPDGTIAPNGYLGTDRNAGGNWDDASSVWAQSPVPHYRVGLFARVVDRVEFRRGDAGTKVVYEPVDTGRFKWNEGMEWAYRLNSFVGLEQSYDRMNSLSRMPYTEEAAKFFHDSLAGLCLLARQIDGFFKSPDALRLAIENQTPLLAGPAKAEDETC